MLRTMGLTFAILTTAGTAHADRTAFLLCEYETLGEDRRWKVQSIPLYYEGDALVAIGKRSHCVDEPEYKITDTHATWRCTTAYDANQVPVRSIYVEVNRYTGRYHRNDFDGTDSIEAIRDIWHGVCTPHHEAQF